MAWRGEGGAMAGAAAALAIKAPSTPNPKLGGATPAPKTAPVGGTRRPGAVVPPGASASAANATPVKTPAGAPTPIQRANSASGAPSTRPAATAAATAATPQKPLPSPRGGPASTVPGAGTTTTTPAAAATRPPSATVPAGTPAASRTVAEPPAASSLERLEALLDQPPPRGLTPPTHVAQALTADPALARDLLAALALDLERTVHPSMPSRDFTRAVRLASRLLALMPAAQASPLTRQLATALITAAQRGLRALPSRAAAVTWAVVPLLRGVAALDVAGHGASVSLDILVTCYLPVLRAVAQGKLSADYAELGSEACRGLAARITAAVAAGIQTGAAHEPASTLLGMLLQDGPESLLQLLSATAAAALQDAAASPESLALASAAFAALEAVVHLAATSGIPHEFPLAAILFQDKDKQPGAAAAAQDAQRKSNAAFVVMERLRGHVARLAAPWLAALPSSVLLLPQNSDLCSAALRVTLHVLRTSAELCEASARQGLAIRLAGLADTRAGPLALLTLAALARGVQSLLLSPHANLRTLGPSMAAIEVLYTPGQAVPLHVSSASCTLEAVAKLLQMAGNDELLASTTSLALATLLGLRGAIHALRNPAAAATSFSASADRTIPIPAPPAPAYLFDGPKLAALRRLFTGFQPRAAGTASALTQLEGLPSVTGLGDGPCCFVAELLAASDGPEAPAALVQGGLADALAQMLPSRLPLASELSPEGVCQLAAALGRLMVSEEGSGPRLLLAPGLYDALAALLTPAYLSKAALWGDVAAATVGAVSGTFACALVAPQGMTPAPGGGDTLRAIQELLLRGGVLQQLLGLITPAPPPPGVLAYTLPAPEAAPALALVWRLISSAQPFLHQLLQGGGLHASLVAAVLSAANPTPVLTEGLLIYSHLARLSKDFYPSLGQAAVPEQLRPLLHHRDPGVRAKACNMIGNMCKHSDYFYGPLKELGLLDSLIQLCSDGDRTTRKFACFAIGNAGFHSDRLYEHLRGSIPPLVELLKDEEPKTRANAAGALGNFVRNSDSLCRDLIHCGAPEALLRMVAARDGSGECSFYEFVFLRSNHRK